MFLYFFQHETYTKHLFNGRLFDLRHLFCYKNPMRKFTFCFILAVILSSLTIADSQNKWEIQLKKYAAIYSHIKAQYPGELNVEGIVFSSIRGILKKLDPHSYFLDPGSYRSMNEDQKGNYFGIGTRIAKYEDRLTVATPLKDTPAYKLGIRAGDIITEIDGEKTDSMSLNDAMKRLRGANGTDVVIKIAREGLKQPLEFKITRTEIPLNTISYSIQLPWEPEIGYISIRTFGNTTASELKEKLDLLTRKKKIKALILDLRGNTGGSLYAAVEVSDFFLEKDKLIVSIKGRTAQQELRAQKNYQYEELPLSILINRGSASASEIVASALQDHQVAKIVGVRSWGKGLVETVRPLALNSGLALTTAKYYTPKNKCLQRDFSELDDYLFFFNQQDYDNNREIEGGVLPDIVVPAEEVPEMIIEFLSKGIFFNFSRHMIDSGKNITLPFKAGKKILLQFQNYLDSKKIKYDRREFEKNSEKIEFQIEQEIVTNKFSAEEGLKSFLKQDPVTAKAVETLKGNIKNR